jgi:hypothetical protein
MIVRRIPKKFESSNVGNIMGSLEKVKDGAFQGLNKMQEE